LIFTVEKLCVFVVVTVGKVCTFFAWFQILVAV
jgi:hypothetical protein